MIQERKFDTFLMKVTPAPKLWLALGLILSIILVKNIYFSIFVLIFSALMVIEEKQITLFKVILTMLSVLFISMYGIYGTMAPGVDAATQEPLFTILGVAYYSEGFAYATKYFLTIGPLTCAMFLLFITMDFTDLGAVMCGAGVPYKVMFTFIDSFQVIILLNKDMEHIQDAQKARGLNTEGSMIQRLKAFAPIMIPVVANAIVKVQDQAIAMDTKGFNSECKKTVYRELIPGKWDGAVKGIGIFLTAFPLVYSVLHLTNVIPAFLTNIMW